MRGERRTTLSQRQRFITLCYACSAMNCTLAFRSGQYTTSRQPQVPDITPQQMIRSLLWKALSSVMRTRHPVTPHMKVQPRSDPLNGKRILIGLCPVIKPAPQRRVKHCSSRYSSRHSWPNASSSQINRHCFAYCSEGSTAQAKAIGWITFCGHSSARTNFAAVTLADVQKQFIADLYNCTVVHIEEINDSRGKSGEKMKKLITESQTRVEAKYQQPYIANKYFNIVASSNVVDPIKIEQNDRRYFVPVYSTHLHSPDETKAFFGDLTTWLEDEGGLQVMANYLHSLNIEAFNFRFPPHTEAKDDITEVSTASEDRVTQASMEITLCYCDCVFALDSVMAEWQMKQSDAKQTLISSGFTKIKRRWTEGSSPSNMWIHRSLIPENNKWSEVSYTLFKRRHTDNPHHSGKKSGVQDGWIMVEE